MQECNPAGTALIKSFESCKLQAYQDGNGIWTIGWGHTGPEVYEGLVWTQERADQQLYLDILERAETPVNAYLFRSVGNNQFSAVCCLCYNIGSGNFRNSTVRKRINAGDFDAVPAAFMMWDRVAGSVSAGLTRRRIAECALWNMPDAPT